MSHDKHAPVEQSKGIWALPMVSLIIVILLLIYYARPIFPQAEPSSHEKIEAPAHEKTEVKH